MTSPSPTPRSNNSLDDIFGSSPPHEEPKHRGSPNPASDLAIEPSELPSLRRQHVTAGYRDGISASKAEHVQKGFDAGFPIGAQLGMRVGTVLGIMEGVLRGYEARAGSGAVKKQPPQQQQQLNRGMKETEDDLETRRVKRDRVLRLYREAVKELDVQAVFAGLDAGGGERGQDQTEKPEEQLSRIGDAVVSKWEKTVRVAHWEENMDVLEAKDEDQTQTETV